MITIFQHPFFKKLILWTTGISSYYLVTWVYDYVVVASCIWYFGLLLGGLIIFIVSIILDLITLMFYDWYKKDWLTLEELKDVENKKGKIGIVLNYIHNKTTIISVIILSIFINPFVVVTYMRKGSHQYNGLKKRDWIIFFSSTIVCNGYWILVIGSGVKIIKYVQHLF